MSYSTSVSYDVDSQQFELSVLKHTDSGIEFVVCCFVGEVMDLTTIRSALVERMNQSIAYRDECEVGSDSYEFYNAQVIAVNHQLQYSFSQ